MLADFDHSFQKIVREAVLACGPDVEAIERYVVERRGSMDPATKEHIRRDIDLVLNFRAPGFGEDKQH